MAAANQIVTELVIHADPTNGAKAFDAAMQKAEAAIQRTTVSMTQSTGRQAAAWQRMAAAADPVTAATQRLEKATIAGNAAMAKGLATGDQVGAVLGTYRAQLAAATAAQGRSATATTLSTQQLAQMQFQLQDIAVGLASGQSPFTVLAQQGSQLAQSFQSGTGVVAALKAVGTGIASFITNPLNLAVLGFAAAAGAVAWLWSKVSASGDADTALERHGALIEGIRDRYGEAAKAATDYRNVAIRVIRDQNDAVENASARMKAYADALEDARTRILAETLVDATGGIPIPDTYGSLTDSAMKFANAVRDGNVDLEAFVLQWETIRNTSPDGELRDSASALLDIAAAAEQAYKDLQDAAGAVDVVAAAMSKLDANTKAAITRANNQTWFAQQTKLRDEAEREAKKAADEATRLAKQQADAIDSVIAGLRFEQDQLGRTAREQSIYNSLKQAGVGLDSAQGQEIASLAGGLYDAEQAQAALNDRIQEGVGLVGAFAQGMEGALVEGERLALALILASPPAAPQDDEEEDAPDVSTHHALAA